ncbi:DNA glycosylase AlkZ-like family protein [Pedococcus bigeumensis]|uniref:Winged helix-turn-helix domain-containing protein n=1 Tax=Pedococcus bigeumensis TaxID=433644 RepID=A0A502CZ40_9MICO|nr:crosslink repair DNA glycosylase YcaQ family protein [Pedococcus bigeumensis]TPG17021.1 winged helix-turn-helix domain-containing protein [Pedococcus bigeumensis]
MSEIRLSSEEARRIAVRAQLLDSPQPTDLLEVVRRLAAVQVDLTAAVAPSADLVCWSRLGGAYALGDLDDLFQERTVVELRGFLRPAEDIALFRAQMAQWPGPEPLHDWQMDVAEWVSANDDCRLDILEQLESEAPLSARQLPDSCVVPWRSTGWTNNKNTQRMLDFMEARGEVAVVSREARERQWDLASRVFPETAAVSVDEALAERTSRRLAALGLARAKAVEAPGEPHDVGAAGEEAVVEGLRGAWRVDPEQLDRLGEPFVGRTVLLSPLDRLVFDRKRMTELFEFDYQLEMYKPVAKRRWGYWALPILHEDRLVGKVDATADLPGGALRVAAVHEDVPFSSGLHAAVDAQIGDLAEWLGLDVVR